MVQDHLVLIHHSLHSWLHGGDDVQKADVHHHSMSGGGTSKWSFVFPVEYLLAENVIVIRKKEHFNSLCETEHHFPPILTMQVWNNDPFSSLSVIGMWYYVHCILF